MHIHVLGICGTFMGGLAALAREAGHRVTGCDTGVYPPMSDQLRALGIELIEGFGADQMALKPDMFVVGNVVSRARTPDGKPKFPLAEAILDSGARYISGPQWLAENVLRGRHVLAVAGTHGKTTTTSMLAWVLECAGKSPGFLIGGVPLVFGEAGGKSARLGGHAATQAPCFVIEADEYDTAFFDKRSKFVHYGPRTAILNNLEFDHADIFDNLAAIERQFHHLVRVVPASGRVVVNAQDDALARVLKMGCYSELVGFGGPNSGAEFTSDGPAHDFAVHSKLIAGLNARVKWALSGSHNQANALAAIAAAQHVGVHPEQAAEALCGFVNAKRRMELRGEVVLTSAASLCTAPVSVYDDFAHHPTAIRVTIDGLRERLNADGKQAERIIAVFEPRSATMKLGTMAGQLPWALEHANMSHCHAAGLSWNPAEPLKLLGHRAQTHMAIDAVVQAVVADARPGDHIVCMSNGGFGGIHQKLLDALQAASKP
jgi:UDP-N-acetylmuramate: L-alanyl-gamma-D-glutamyl-meso-diaminopimelate ligase